MEEEEEWCVEERINGVSTYMSEHMDHAKEIVSVSSQGLVLG